MTVKISKLGQLNLYFRPPPLPLLFSRIDEQRRTHCAFGSESKIWCVGGMDNTHACGDMKDPLEETPSLLPMISVALSNLMVQDGKSSELLTKSLS